MVATLPKHRLQSRAVCKLERIMGLPITFVDLDMKNSVAFFKRLFIHQLH